MGGFGSAFKIPDDFSGNSNTLLEVFFHVPGHNVSIGTERTDRVFGFALRLVVLPLSTVFNTLPIFFFAELLLLSQLPGMK